MYVCINIREKMFDLHDVILARDNSTYVRKCALCMIRANLACENSTISMYMLGLVKGGFVD